MGSLEVHCESECHPDGATGACYRQVIAAGCEKRRPAKDNAKTLAICATHTIHLTQSSDVQIGSHDLRFDFYTMFLTLFAENRTIVN